MFSIRNTIGTDKKGFW